MINKIFLLDHNQVLEDIKDSFQLVNNWYEAEAVVVWQDIRDEYIELVSNANLVGIPTVVMQHGLRASREYDNFFQKPLLAKKIMVWGPKDKRRVLSGGIIPERIEITGTTIFDHLMPKENHQGVNILFAPLHWDKEIEENYLVASKLKSIKGINVLTKVIEGQNLSYYENSIISNRDEKSHLDIISSIFKNTDLVVSLAESTLEFMAYFLNIPVIVVDFWKPKEFLDYYVDDLSKYFGGFSKNCVIVKLNELDRAITNELYKDSKNSIKRNQVLLEEAGIGFSNKKAKDRIVEVIKNLDKDLF